MVRIWVMDVSFYWNAFVILALSVQQLALSLVTKGAGGKGGGGTRLTPEGERAIETFWRLYHEFQGTMVEYSKNVP